MIHEYTKYNKDVLNILYATKFLSTDPTRKVLNYLFVEDNIMVATDGRKLCTVQLVNGLLDGLYRVIKATKNLVMLDSIHDDELRYPSWKQVMPEKEGCREFNIRGNFELCYTASAFGCFVDFERNLPVDVEGRLFIRGAMSPLLIENEEVTTVIMPYNVTNSKAIVAYQIREDEVRAKVAKEMNGDVDSKLVL